MTNNSTHPFSLPNEVLLFSVIFKFIAMGIGVMGNTAVIIYNIFMLKERTATSDLIANLALADLLVCLTFYPIWIVEFIRTMLEIGGDQDLFCKMSRSSMLALMFASVATLLAITIDRYLFIVKPLKYPMIVTRRRIFLVVLGIWLTASGLLFVLQLHFVKFNVGLRSACYVPSDFYKILNTFSFYVPLTLIFAINIQILKVAREQRSRILSEEIAVRQIREQSRKREETSPAVRVFQASKAAKTFFIVVVVLAFCVLFPTITGEVLYVYYLRETRYWQIWYVVFNHELYGINSIVNPFIYGARHVKYRKAYENILFKFLRCEVFTKEIDCS